MILDFLSTARHLIERSLDNWHPRANRKLLDMGPILTSLGGLNGGVGVIWLFLF